MPPVEDHPLRYATVNELHARPFPALSVPSTAVFIAVKAPQDAANRDRALDRAHLLQLLDRYGAPHPHAGANHYSGVIGRAEIIWESHTEFVTYSAFSKGISDRPFDPAETQVFPEDWMALAPGQRMASVLIRIDELPEDESELIAKTEGWFVPESLALARIAEGEAVIAGDFRIDAAGHMRFAVFVKKGNGPRRVGRIVQRLCEIEIYRSMSMLALFQARDLTESLNRIDPALSALVSGLDNASPSAEGALHELLSISSELERLSAQHSFRFGATKAYEAIINQRISIMREDRMLGRQTFAEFMTRRFDPAMRTVESTEKRLNDLANRAQRAAELLRTRVDVERSAQNQLLLQSMDTRADLALRLQHTVEGLSVVAIGYYAVSLASYAFYPIGKAAGLGKEMTTAALVVPVLGFVWWGLRKIRQHLH